MGNGYCLQPDDVLMQLSANDSDTQAFGCLVRRHQARVLSYAARMFGGDIDTAADIAQEVFLRLWESRSKYTPRGTLLSYLLHIAHNQCLSRFRYAARLSEKPLEDYHHIPTSPSLFGKARAVRDAVIDLPQDHRAVFVLSEYEGFSYAEIAEILGIPEGTVASRKNRAITLLRADLTRWLNDSEGGNTK